MTDTRPIPVAQPFDLSAQVVGLERESRNAGHMPPSKGGPPPRIDGYNVGAALVQGEGPHLGERHPDGDEVVYLISGRMQVLLELEDGDRCVDMSSGQAIVVPRGVWHRIVSDEPAHIVHITPGPRGEARPRT